MKPNNGDTVGCYNPETKALCYVSVTDKITTTEGYTNLTTYVGYDSDGEYQEFEEDQIITVNGLIYESNKEKLLEVLRAYTSSAKNFNSPISVKAIELMNARGFLLAN